MKYSTRIKRKANGDTQIRITIDVTAKEVDGVNRIADDQHCNLESIKQGHELSLAYARIFCFWVDMWNQGSKELVTRCAQHRKMLEQQWAERANNKRKKRATRSRKK